MASSLQKPKPGVAAAILVPLGVWILFSAVAVVILIGGITSIEGTVDDFDRVAADDTGHEVDLDAGDYRIFAEGPNANEEYFTPSVVVTVTDSAGNDVPTGFYVGSLRYGAGGHEGTAVYTVDIPQDGTYTVTASSADGRVRNVALGTENPLATVGVAIALFFVVGGIGFLIALILLIVLLVKRGRSKKQIFQAQAAAYQQGQQPGYPQGPWGAGQQ